MSNLCKSITEHPCWPHVCKRLQVEEGTPLATGKVHRRIELLTKGLATVQLRWLLNVRIECAQCHKSMAPFRGRKRGNAGRAERPSRLFVSVACELADSVGCARGNAASMATTRLAAAIAGGCK